MTIRSLFAYQRRFMRNLKNLRLLSTETSNSINQHYIHGFSPGIAASGHLPLAKTIWTQVIKVGDTVVDATCGNGHDSLALAQLALNESKGQLVCIDIQSIAIDATKDRLSKVLLNYPLLSDRIHCYCQSHETFPINNIINANSVSVINYNLGYLPRGDRDLSYQVDGGPITQPSSTISSLTQAMMLIRVQGVITIMSYRGHPGGNDEYIAIQEYCRSLNPKVWRVYSHDPLNRPLSPVLFTIMKCKSI